MTNTEQATKIGSLNDAFCTTLMGWVTQSRL